MKKRTWDTVKELKGTRFHGEWPTLVETFLISAERYPDRKCFTAYDPDYLSFTYAEAVTQIKKTANYLGSLGVKKGDRIGVTGKNSPEWALAYLSILFAGGVVIPLDYGLHDEEISGLIKTAGAKIIFVDEEKFDSFDRRKSGVKTKISLSPAKDNYILNLESSKQYDPDLPTEEDLAAILFTSGTTGISKGVMLTHRNFVSDCYLAQGNMAIFAEDVFYALLPLHHSYSMLAVFIESFSTGAETIFAKRLAVKQIFKDLKQGHVTMLLGIPMLFNKIIKGLMRGIREKGVLVYGLIRGMMAFSGFIKKLTGMNIGKKLFKGILAKVSLDTNRICICGGGPLPASTFKYFNQMGIDFVQGYGLTETAPILALNPVEHYKEESVGKIIPSVECRIADPDEDGNGEIQVKGPMVMKGYFNNPEATAEVFTEDGFLRTGDVGHLDSENYLYLTGRAKSLIVTEGGKNVFPEEIEDHFQLYEEVEQVLIRGFILDEKMKTEGIEALIYPSEEFRKMDREALETRCRAIIDEVNKDLKSYQKIRRVTVLDEAMEMTTTKKIKRFKVAEKK